jgi:valyl-tRNA synthetase
MSSSRELASTFSPAEIEAPLYEKWIKAGYFTADAQSSKPSFSIVLPPPNVTGVLHIGHALDQTLQDCLSRMKRMQGFEVLWLPGMDHAGIATQNVVEKQLAASGKSRHDLGREEFVKKSVALERRIWRGNFRSDETPWSQCGLDSRAIHDG